mgnify:CR=1 FL=1|tara:strand:- start:5852 stop:6346 length:495 start_codon:yes stop_codon:yes gene_type:complete
MLNLFQSTFLISSLFFFIWIITNTYYSLFFKKKKNNIEKNKQKRKIFMGLILIIFGIMKLYNLSKFVKIFGKYDIISNKFNLYGYLYPFIEILLGILILKNYYINPTLNFIIILMIISIISVILSLIKGEKLRCGCLGSFFHMPLSYVTLSENILMLIMSYKIK